MLIVECLEYRFSPCGDDIQYLFLIDRKILHQNGTAAGDLTFRYFKHRGNLYCFEHLYIFCKYFSLLYSYLHQPLFGIQRKISC